MAEQKYYPAGNERRGTRTEPDASVLMVSAMASVASRRKEPIYE
jgi:hypothetical protein